MSWARVRLGLLAVVAVLAVAAVALVAGSKPLAAAAAAPACASSAVGVALLPPGGPYVAGTPFRQNIFQATDNHGRWAGVRYDGFFGFQIISWQAGRVTVLDTFKVNGMSGDPAESARVVGITGSGAVIVDRQSPTRPDSIYHVGYSYQYGKRFPLASQTGWVGWRPTGVSPTGHIAGVALTHHGSYVVEWNGAFSVSTVAADVIGRPSIDQYDDLIWYQSSSTSAAERYRTARGRLGLFSDGAGVPPDVEAVSGRWAWARGSVDSAGIEVFDMAPAVQGSPELVRTLPTGWPVHGAVSGTFVESSFVPEAGPLYFYDSYFDQHRIPHTADNQSSVAIAADGTVAYTGTDGNVRFYRCRLDSTGHEPAGRLYTASATGNSVTITGGGFDPDLPDAPVTVDVYDQTGTKKFLGRYPANQISTNPTASWYKLNRQSFTATFTATPGTHKYCVYGLNLRYGNVNPILFCTTVTVG